MQSDPGDPGGTLHKQTVSLQCLQCSGAEFAYPTNPEDDAELTCTACGAVATLAKLRGHAVGEHARKLTTDLLAQGLKGIKGWKKRP